MSRLILHIGTHKTATTTLQRHLARNRKALAARGIWYPDYGLIGKSRHYAHLGIVNAFSGKHDKYSVEDARRFFREVGARARKSFSKTLYPCFRNMMVQGLNEQ